MKSNHKSMDIDDSIALGTKVFKRTDKLRNLLESVPEYVETVYIADDGETSERSNMYSNTYPFKLNILDLDYDEGLGAGRHAIVNELEEDYLVIVDSDHILPENLYMLWELLNSDENLGGVSGAIVEPHTPAYYITGQFFEEKGNNLYRSPFSNENVRINVVNGNSIIYFDFIANAAMFRRECLEEYNWDPTYVIGYEHVDFYIGHWKETEWNFGVCPNVVFEHYPGGASGYNTNRHSKVKLTESEAYFLNKWNYEQDVSQGFRWVRGPPSSGWYFRARMSPWQKALIVLVLDGPKTLLKKLRLNLFPK